MNGENPPSRTSTKEMDTFQEDYEESFADLKGSEALLEKEEVNYEQDEMHAILLEKVLSSAQILQGC